ncbi:MAG: ATP-binding cassette domain-containing protein [Gemmatimonadaceae bacterium]|nr:ATP-binding cassette domain-containing protein [Gemmatimonadaceae bacterium]
MSLRVTLQHRQGSFSLEPNFSVDDGITALVGPSGAGKTLTLRAVAGLLHPARGRVVVNERVLLDTEAHIDVPARDRSVGVLFQQYALFPHLSVAQNVAYGLHGISSAARETRVSELLELVGLPSFHARHPDALSGGQQQRVALARALAPQPALLLLDEPFAAVDLGVRRRLREELRRVHEAVGTPMVLVTHDLDEVQQIADRVVVMDRGRVQLVQPVGELLEGLAPVRELLMRDA